MLSEHISGLARIAAAKRCSSVMPCPPPVVILMTASVRSLISGRKFMNIAGSGVGRPFSGLRACKWRIAAPASAAPIAFPAISSGVIGRYRLCDGTWTAPVTAQVTITLRLPRCIADTLHSSRPMIRTVNATPRSLRAPVIPVYDVALVRCLLNNAGQMSRQQSKEPDVIDAERPARQRALSREPVAVTDPAPRPERMPHEGRFARLEPLDVALHGEEPWEVAGDPASDATWDYLGYGPWSSEVDYLAWLREQQVSDDPMFIAIRNKASGKAVGIGTFMRIAPEAKSIEIG